jgi:AcrR family transcriptional regulator
MDELRMRIIDAAVIVFNENGIKFTMDDIAKKLSISKKTIYREFDSKEALFMAAADRGFALIKSEEKKILDNMSLSTIEKLKKVLIVLPDNYKNIDWRKISEIEKVYPQVFEHIVTRVNTQWEPTIALIEKGISDGSLRKFSIPVFKIMVESSIRGFIEDTELTANAIGYEEALEDMIDVLLKGIAYENKNSI